MPKRVLFVHGISRIGGAEQELLRLLEGLDRREWEPYLACPPGGPLPGDAEKLQVSVYPMNFPAWRKLKDVFRIPAAVGSLGRLMRRQKINLVHVNDYWWGPISCIAARMAHVPCLVHIRQEIEPRRVGQYWLRKPQRLIAVSQRIQKVVVEGGVGPGRIRVIYSGIDLSQALSPDAAVGIRERYRLSAHQPLIGTVANLFPRKGYEYLIDALAEVRKEIPDIHCLVIGEGDDAYRESLLRRVETLRLTSALTFAGFQKDVLPYIAGLDLFVLPSLMEGFGIALIEAMSMGKPVIATAVGGIPEVIEDGISGMLVPPSDSSALAQMILHLLKNPELRERLGSAAQARVREKFSAQRMIAQFQDLYREMSL